MSRVVVVIDSATGAAVDVAGNKRETGRYAKFTKRMLSLDKNPTLDFGGNGGNTLTIARNGGVVKDTVINLVAETVKVSGTIKDKDGRTMEQIATDQFKNVLDMISGTINEVDVSLVDGSSSSDELPRIQISLDNAFINRIEALEKKSSESEGDAGYITKTELADALDGVSVQDDDDFDTVKSQFAALLTRLSELAGIEVASPSSSSSVSGLSESSSSSGEDISGG